MNSVSDDMLKVMLDEAEVLVREYGSLHLLTPRTGVLKNFQALVMTINPSRHTRKHIHPYEEMFFVLKGKVQIECNDSTVNMGLNDTAIILPNEAHRVLNPSLTEPCEVLIALSPPRKSEDVVYLE